MSLRSPAAGAATGPSLALFLLLVHAGLRVLEQTVIRTGMSIDGFQQIPWVETWQWGYSPTQPPLHTWLFKLFLLAVPDFRLADVLFRQLLVVATVLLCFGALRSMGLGARNAAFSAAALFLVTDFAWDGQATYTHSVLALAALFWFALRFVEQAPVRSLGGYVHLGVALAAVTLSKYNALLPVLGLLLASLTVPRFRHVVIARAFLLTPLTALFLCGPHLVWRWTFSEPFLGEDRIQSDGAFGELPAILVGAGGVGLALVAQLLPLLVVLLIGFGGKLGWMRRTPNGASDSCGALFGRAFLISFAAFAGFIIASGATNIVMRWLLPTASLLVLALPAAASAAGRAQIYAKTVFVGATICTALTFSAMLVRDAVLDPYLAMDYRAFSANVIATVGPFEAYASFGPPALDSVVLHTGAELLTRGDAPLEGRTIALAWPESETARASAALGSRTEADLACDHEIVLRHRFRTLSETICLQKIVAAGR